MIYHSSYIGQSLELKNHLLKLLHLLHTEIDEDLSKSRVSCKIKFLNSVDLLWVFLSFGVSMDLCIHSVVSLCVRVYVCVGYANLVDTVSQDGKLRQI